MVTLYGPAMSSARRCLWALHEIGVPFVNAPVDMQNKEHKSPAFMAMNPNGKVPILVDGDVTMWESLAITTYLVDKYKPEWFGTTPEARATVHQWSFWAAVNLATALDVLSHQAWRKTPDDALTDAARQEAFRAFLILDSALAGKDYLVNNTFGLADLNVAGVAMTADFVKFDLSGTPNVAAYLARCADRDGYKKLTA